MPKLTFSINEKVMRGAIGVGGEELGQDLNRHGAIEPGVARLVDLAHAPRPDGAQDFIGTKALAGGEGHAGRIMPDGGVETIAAGIRGLA